MQQQTTYSMHALCIDRCKQDVASLGTTWPHGATYHLQHACLLQIQGKRRGERGRVVGGMGFGFEGNADQNMC